MTNEGPWEKREHDLLILMSCISCIISRVYIISYLHLCLFHSQSSLFLLTPQVSFVVGSIFGWSRNLTFQSLSLKCIDRPSVYIGIRLYRLNHLTLFKGVNPCDSLNCNHLQLLLYFSEQFSFFFDNKEIISVRKKGSRRGRRERQQIVYSVLVLRPPVEVVGLETFFLHICSNRTVCQLVSNDHF